MKNSFYPIILLVLISFGCDKEVEPKPAALFSFSEEESPTLKMGTNDESILINKSQHGTTYLWDFGDGRTSTDKDVILSYPKSGTYEVKLTVSNADGVKSESKKQVVVLDRVLRKIIIEQVQWYQTNQEGLSVRWPKTLKADIFFQIQRFTDLQMGPLGIYPACPVIYTSPIIKDVKNWTNDPIEIPVKEKIIMEKNRENPDYSHWVILQTLNQVNIYSLMAIDNNGQIFNLYNNHGGGGNSVRIEKEDVKQNSYIVDFTLFSRIRLVCEYE